MVATHKEPAGAENAGPLKQEEIVDAADNSTQAPQPDLKGKRVRAIPQHGATTVIVDESDFKLKGISQKQVTFDFRTDRFTVAVGDGYNQISKEAADFLTSNYPMDFEYLNA